MARAARFAVFLGIVILVLCGIHLYLWVRLVGDPRLPGPWFHLATALLVTLAVSLPAVFFLNRALTPRVARVVLFPPYLWMGTMLLLFALLLLGDLGRLLVTLGLSAAGHGALLADPATRLVVARVCAAVVAGTAAILTAVGVVTALGPPVVRRVEVALAGLPPALDGLTIAHLTDLHVGPTLGAASVERVVARTNGLHPDVVAITGDLVDGSVARLRTAVAPLAGLRAPLGVYFVTGNHEFYAGAAAWLAEVTRLGVRVLENERVGLERGGEALDLAGVHDLEGQGFGARFQPDLDRALAGRDPRRALVLLAHQPRLVRAAARAGVGLQLSGHTHGGQLWPWRYLVYLQQPFVAGLHRVGATSVYVSEGTGFWGPAIRLGTRNEIALVTLRCTAGARPTEQRGEIGPGGPPRLVALDRRRGAVEALMHLGHRVSDSRRGAHHEGHVRVGHAVGGDRQGHRAAGVRRNDRHEGGQRRACQGERRATEERLIGARLEGSPRIRDHHESSSDRAFKSQLDAARGASKAARRDARSSEDVNCWAAISIALTPITISS